MPRSRLVWVSLIVVVVAFLASLGAATAARDVDSYLAVERFAASSIL